MHFAELVPPAILFSSKLKAATCKTAIYIQLSNYIPGNSDESLMVFV